MDEGQFSLRGLVQGCGTDYDIKVAHIAGLGIPDVVASDTAYGDRDGDVGGRDRYGHRVLTFPILLKAPDATKALADRQAYVHALRRPFVQAWARVIDAADIELTGPHLGGMWPIDEPTFFGRPRPVTMDLSDQWRGFIHATAQFVCTDPLAYGDVVTEAGGSPIAFVNDSDLPTYRAVVTMVGDGGTPSLTATNDAGRVVSWLAPLAGGDIAVLDFYSQTLTVNGVAVYPLDVDDWFRLVPGANSIVWAGAASASIDYRPAYL